MKVNPKLNAAIDRLADLIENGHLLACTFSDDFINQACDEIEKLRADLEHAQAKILVKEDDLRRIIEERNSDMALSTERFEEIKILNRMVELMAHDMHSDWSVVATAASYRLKPKEVAVPLIIGSYRAEAEKEIK